MEFCMARCQGILSKMLWLWTIDSNEWIQWGKIYIFSVGKVKYFIRRNKFSDNVKITWLWHRACWCCYRLIVTLLKVKLLFSPLNFAWNLVFILELWKILFSSLNFEKVHFYTWIPSFDFILKGRNSCVKTNFFKVQRRKTNFIQSLRTKTIV